MKVGFDMKIAASVLALIVSAVSADVVISDFEDFNVSGYGTLAPESAWYGQSGNGGYQSGSAYFNTNWSYDSTWDMEFWDGFACSNTTDTVTNSFTNQFSAITGSGVDGSANYAIASDGVPSYSSIYRPSVDLDSPTLLSGVYVTNTTYAYLTMQAGSMFSLPFGGADGSRADWFKLTVKGLDANGGETGSVEFTLADYTFENNQEDYIVDTWTWVDLTDLGIVNGLSFEISGSDVGQYGLNTPSYFALDNLTAVPEPASIVLVSAAMGLVALRRRK